MIASSSLWVLCVLVSVCECATSIYGQTVGTSMFGVVCLLAMLSV